jgi:hypothetical protein
VKADNPDVVHIWYNGDIVMIAYLQAVQLNVAPSYLLFGVDPGVWQERGLKSTVPICIIDHHVGLMAELCAGWSCCISATRLLLVPWKKC